MILKGSDRSSDTKKSLLHPRGLQMQEERIFAGHQATKLSIGPVRRHKRFGQYGFHISTL